jgi:hypothetical protein
MALVKYLYIIEPGLSWEPNFTRSDLPHMVRAQARGCCWHVGCKSSNPCGPVVSSC